MKSTPALESRDIYRNVMPMDPEHKDFYDGDRSVPVSSRTSRGSLSIEECERLVLSPPPVPMDLDLACAAIHAAARRSNSSRTHSIKTQPDGYGDTHGHPSEQDLSKPQLEPIPSYPRKTRHRRPTFSWRRLLCCYSSYVDSPKVPERPQLTTVGSPVVPIPHPQNGEPVKKLPDDNSADQAPKVALRFWSSPRRSKIIANNLASTAPLLVPEESRVHPSPSSNCTTGYLRDTSVTSTAPSYHATLPGSVLNALASNHQEPSYPHPVLCTADTSSTSVVPSRASAPPCSSAMYVPPPIKPHSSFTITFPRLHAYNRHSIGSSSKQPPPTTGYTSHLQIPVSGSSEVNQDAYASDAVHLRGNYPGTTNLWNSGDVVDHHAPTIDSELPDYGQSGSDQNGAQGDSSSENLEMLTPGMDLLGEPTSDCVNKKCLVLDLDETLVHSWFKYVENANFIVPVELDGVKHQIFVCKRPHLDEFLREIGPLFECVMFTASLRKYADPVCDFIDESSHFRHRLFREACVYHQNNLIKDLSRLGRDVDQVCIVDNSAVSFLFQPNNALHIVSWFDDPNDQALLGLIPYLRGLAKSDTVVDYLRQFQPPPSAVVAHPPTPSCLLLFNTAYSNDSEDNEGSDHLDEIGYEYSDEEAVLSPHFHPPLPASSTALLRTYLTQLDAHSNTTVHPSSVQQYPRGNFPPSATTSSIVATTTSFIHQMARPDPHYTTTGSSVSPLSVPVEVIQDSSSTGLGA
ncbi:hypothetical protein CRM22_005749 [Opisthorchis felineus]|uniref:FCP1 homology domain-containing protein n=1 Tax=Opisthorchis felineus TaxID=147828 RepID=A0A4S2LWP2_OPIFE|nr:hypothetical protein CRM22_005749 [Opisthorchis felineus]